MDFLNWSAFVVASVVLLLLPGPTVLLVVAYAVSQGRRVALAMAAGVALGDLVAMTVSLAGLGALLATSASLFTLLKWIGAAYLVYLGVRLWRSKPVSTDPADEPRPKPVGAVFAHAFLVTALNPKSIAFFVAFVPQFVDRSAPILPQLVILEATFVGLAAANALFFAMAGDLVRSRLRRPAVLAWINRAGAGCLIGMGAATAALHRS